MKKYRNAHTANRSKEKCYKSVHACNIEKEWNNENEMWIFMWKLCTECTKFFLWFISCMKLVHKKLINQIKTLSANLCWKEWNRRKIYNQKYRQAMKNSNGMSMTIPAIRNRDTKKKNCTITKIAINNAEVDNGDANNQ